MEFKKTETEAALNLMGKLRMKADDLESAIERWDKRITEIKEKDSDSGWTVQEISLFMIQDEMELQLLLDNIELIRKQIINQSFNF